MKRQSSIKRAEDVRLLTLQHYEPGRHDRCKRWVYLHHIYPRFGISESTFFRDLREQQPSVCRKPEDKRQLKLFPSIESRQSHQSY
jgi:hypothetical protein